MALTTTARTDPTSTATMIENGFSTKIAFEDVPALAIWEKSVQPPGIDGGNKIDVTTMFNATVRTYAPQALSEMTDSSVTAGYDPAVLPTILTLVNEVQTVTIHLPNTATWDFFGYLKSFVPAALTNGTHPEAACTIVSTNRDPADGAETDPDYTAPSP